MAPAASPCEKRRRPCANAAAPGRSGVAEGGGAGDGGRVGSVKSEGSGRLVSSTVPPRNRKTSAPTSAANTTTVVMTLPRAGPAEALSSTLTAAAPRDGEPVSPRGTACSDSPQRTQNSHPALLRLSH